MALEGFIDVTAVLHCGVYLLLCKGRVVYVGKSKVPLTRIYSHRNLARGRQVPWLRTQGIVYDTVHVMPVHPDRLDEVEQALIMELAPRYNVTHNTALPYLPRMERRI